MQINDLSHKEENGYQVLSASVIWEDNDWSEQQVFFRYRVDKSYIVSDNYHPFLLAVLIPALRYGERRIKINGSICPWFRDNLYTLMAYYINWYWYKFARKREDKRLIEIEAVLQKKGYQKPARTAAFFSAGVDSLYTVRRNQLNVPKEHAGSIKDLIFVHGFDIGVIPERGAEEEFFDYIIQGLQEFIEKTGLNLIPTFTNLRSLTHKADLFSSNQVWLDEYMGPAMAAVAHGLSGRLSDVLISSSYEIPKLHPFSSHPMIEPHLSSYDLRVHHDGERLNRVERVKLIAEWPLALSTLRVCFDGETGQLNCGKCPKCIRTKLELMCAGKLQEAHTLPGGEPSAQTIKDGLHLANQTISFASTLKASLKEIGRADLAKAITYKEWQYYLSQVANWKKMFSIVDKVVLKGWLRRKFIGP
ncbi:hypothetical protein SAMN05421880_1183 [Nitrosomonas nitrosa]|uniref:7-cyano-7-deazaguanine synthase (Queuosine biosynthesis) n=2 Tax=Nitrosomonas nitrosa TaxID=52442 RepID=A0A1I4R849_9PROT|nr:hypothetical protein SAMN05421880_1183 [Nitrosomonas nitrosa]